MDEVNLRSVITDALAYWERRRLIYNGVLAAVVLAYFAAGLPKSASVVTFDIVQGLFVLAVLANLAYCAVYVPDVFAQLSGFGERWRRFRWVILAIGCAFAAVITRVFVIGALP